MEHSKSSRHDSGLTWQGKWQTEREAAKLIEHDRADGDRARTALL